MSRYFATEDEVRRVTATVDIDEATRRLNEGGSISDVRPACPVGGPVIWCGNDGTEQVVADDSHSIAFASTGKGKTRRYIYPTVMSDILSGTNIVVNDMKGEIYASTRDLLAAAGYTTYVLDLRNPRESPNRFNPLDLAWLDWHAGDDDTAFMRLRSFASSVFTRMNVKGVDPFWANSSIDYFVGLTLGMLEAGVSREAFTLESVAVMDRVGDIEYGGRTHLERMFELFPSTSVALQSVSGTMGAPDRTKHSVFSTFRQPMALYSGQRALMDVLCRSDFSIEDLARDRRAFFVISPDETHSLGPIVVGILNQVMSGLITHAQDAYGGVLPNRVDFILDEMGNLPAKIPDLEALVSAARSRNIRFHFVVQSADQLTNVYGEELKNVILDNCDTWVFMGSRGLSFLRQISELAGTVRLESGEERPLLSVDKLQHLETRETETEALIFTSSLRPFVAALKDVSQYAVASRKAPGTQAREKVRHELFDITSVTRSDIIYPPSYEPSGDEPPGVANGQEVPSEPSMNDTLISKLEEIFASEDD